MQCDVIKNTGLTFRCCDSCHEDYDYYGGEYACEVELNGVTLLVCCACARALEGEPSKDDWHGARDVTDLPKTQ